MTGAGAEPAWVEIDTGRIAQNYRAARSYLPPGTGFCAVLKADAYGHGIANVLPVLMARGVEAVGIISNAEARTVRACGFTGRVMRLRPPSLEEAEAALPLNVEELIGGIEAARALAALGARAGRVPRVHLALNAGGMGREGLELDQPGGRAEGQAVVGLEGIEIAGLMTHFPSNVPDDLGPSLRRFEEDVRAIVALGQLDAERLLIHGGSSLTLVSGVRTRFDMMRCGAALYGIVGPRSEFAYTMALKSRVTALPRFPAGLSVGYDRSVHLTRPSLLANVSVGYANGYRRQFASGGAGLVRGQRLPVLGKISMNACVLDATDAASLAVGDEVVLFGPQNAAEITCAETEAVSGTIIADLMVEWGALNAKVVV